MKKINLLSLLAIALFAVAFTGCKKETPLPPIGGYNNADEVASDNLVAYWGLNGDGKEAESSTMPSEVKNVTWVDGVKGKAAHMDAGFLKYPSIVALTQFDGSISVSCWAIVSNTKLTPDGVSNISPLFCLTGGPNGNIGNLSIFGNTHGLTTSDSIQLKAEYHFKNPDGNEFGGDCINMIKQESWMDDTHTWNANKIGGKWAHIVWVWDGATANTRLYVNGVKISNSAWERRNNGNPMPFAVFTPSYPVIGATWSVAEGTNTDTWNAALKGDVDEVRVYNKLLTVAEINSLYQLELAGR